MVTHQSDIQIILEHAQCGVIVEPICRGVVRYIVWCIDERIEQLLQRYPNMSSGEKEEYRGHH